MKQPKPHLCIFCGDEIDQDPDPIDELWALLGYCCRDCLYINKGEDYYYGCAIYEDIKIYKAKHIDRFETREERMNR
jgi:hypothetical protein